VTYTSAAATRAHTHARTCAARTRHHSLLQQQMTATRTCTHAREPTHAQAHLTSVRCGLRAVPYASECALRHCVVGCSGLNDVAHDVRAATYTLMDQSDAFSDRRSPHALPSLPTLPTLPSLPTLFPIDVPRPTTSQAERTVAGRVRVRVCACESACGRVCVFACEQRALCRASLRCMFHCLARWRGHSV
jgi:hypothetical protein